ncbi:hypothetical protein [Pedobacter sp. MR22-3]|uniref:phosphoribosyltransferase-like protein n=1 Tax=Pedobacter sp. MR22-3 TaxID=2994552 RepID=UPI0022472ACE|nr:hypothetical protein [Pedobacter sp. MR22-3]MCX2584797.1 hypothetical protein [Pedobacter sp. MR22-3]
MTQLFEEELHKKIKILNETTWESKVKKPKIIKWLDNFKTQEEKSHALFLLSNFMYFGNIQIRQLLISLYRDLFKYPAVEKIRLGNDNTTDISFINEQFVIAQKKTRFIGLGNASESGAHLLYWFRQENGLSVDLFPDSSGIFNFESGETLTLKEMDVDHYVLFDDFCGSGRQACTYSDEIVTKIKAINPNIRVSCLMLFATKKGKERVVKKSKFDFVDAVVELDDSFKCFDSNSRYFQNCPDHIDKEFMKKICMEYCEPLVRSVWVKEGFEGEKLEKMVQGTTLGFGDCQLLIGFYHNTPNNTLPIIWYDEKEETWFPIFKRFNKIYNS